MLTIDIGNTRLKWVLWKNNKIIDKGECVHHALFDSALFERGMPVIDTVNIVAVANVAGVNVVPALERWLAEKNADEIELFILKTNKQCCGVIHAYKNPAKHGVDRWAALIAAKSLCATAVCVIDVGSAVTVDVMSKEGLHDGGLIMPGLAMMQQSLLDNTADLSYEAIDSSSVSSVFTNTTEAAVQNGVFKYLSAGVESICLQAKNKYEGEVTIFITGGMADLLVPVLSNQTITYEPDLVLIGLRIAASDWYA